VGPAVGIGRVPERLGGLAQHALAVSLAVDCGAVAGVIDILARLDVVSPAQRAAVLVDGNPYVEPPGRTPNRVLTEWLE